MELGRSGRTLVAAAAAPAAMVWSAARASAASFRYGVIAKQAALKDQAFQARLSGAVRRL
jgi:hypothetical protein